MHVCRGGSEPLSVPRARLYDVSEKPTARPTVLAVDGNSLLHRSFHARAATAFRLRDGRAAWAVKGLVSQLAAAVERSCADAVVVGFDDPEHSVRRQQWPVYKAQRNPKLDALVEQLHLAVEVLNDLGVHVVVPAGLEADDVLASTARHARALGAQTVIATSDRDAFALIDDNTRVLRILNGGVEASPMLDPDRLHLLTGVWPQQYRDFAALRGDPSDNLPGVRGVGPRKASLLLAEFGCARAAFDDARGDGERCRRVLGRTAAARLGGDEARDAWQFNLQVMAMHDTVAIGVDPSAGTGTLPLAPSAVRAVFDRLDLFLPSGLKALCGTESTAMPEPDDLDEQWRPRPSRTVRFPPLRPKQPARLLQDTLF